MKKPSCAVIMVVATFQGWVLFCALGASVIASGNSVAAKLIADLLAAKTESMRKELLRQRKEFLTLEVEKGLVVSAEVLSHENKNSEALSAYKLVYLVAEEIGDQEGIASALRAMGDLESARGRYSEALKLYNRSLKTGEGLGNKRVIALAFKCIGSIYAWRGEYEQALQNYRKSLKLAEELGSKEVTALALEGIGLVHFWEGDYEESLKSYEESLRLSEVLNERKSIARLLMGIGIVYKMQGKYAEAFCQYRKSWGVMKQLGNKMLLARLMTNIGLLYEMQGNFKQALEFYQSGLQQYKEIGDSRSAVMTLNSVGHAYSMQSKTDLALRFYRRSLKLGEELGQKEEITIVLKNIGDIYSSNGRYGTARQYYQRSQSLQEEIGDKEMMARLLINIGKTYYSQEKPSKTTELAERASALARQIGSPERLWEARNLAGLAYTKLGQLDLAEEALEQAIDTIERLRHQVAGNEQERERYFEGKVSPYVAMVDLLVKRNKAPEALSYAEAAKARCLLDVLGNGKASISGIMTSEERIQQRDLNVEILAIKRQLHSQDSQPQSAELYNRLDKAELKHEAFETGLYAAHPDLKLHLGEIRPLTMNEAVDLIDGKTAWLEFVVMREKVHLFVLTKGTEKLALKAYSIGITRKELGRRIGEFRNRLMERRWNFEEAARQFYALLFGPAKAQLQGKSTLCIAPDDILWDLPFQALLVANVKFLIDDYAISLTPSLSVLREMSTYHNGGAADQSQATFADKSTNAAPKTLLAFGNPSRSQKLALHDPSILREESESDLPEAETEVKILRRLYGPLQSKIYIGDAASEKTAKSEMGKYRILHFATHGFLDDRNPLDSNLLLSQRADDVEDGVLEARELINMRLKADVAVLSACETARGGIRTGEGLIGLSWAFFVAGCPTTVVSQWRVNSHSTAQLMTEFHRNLIRVPGVSKAMALQQAALKLRRGPLYDHPFYWAAFTVVGKSDSKLLTFRSTIQEHSLKNYKK